MSSGPQTTTVWRLIHRLHPDWRAFLFLYCVTQKSSAHSFRNAPRSPSDRHLFENRRPSEVSLASLHVNQTDPPHIMSLPRGGYSLRAHFPLPLRHIFLFFSSFTFLANTLNYLLQSVAVARASLLRSFPPLSASRRKGRVRVCFTAAGPWSGEAVFGHAVRKPLWIINMMNDKPSRSTCPQLVYLNVSLPDCLHSVSTAPVHLRLDGIASLSSILLAHPPFCLCYCLHRTHFSTCPFDLPLSRHVLKPHYVSFVC